MHETPHRSDAADLLACGTFALRRALDELARRALAADAARRVTTEASGHVPARVEAARSGQGGPGAFTGDWGLA